MGAASGSTGVVFTGMFEISGRIIFGVTYGFGVAVGAGAETLDELLCDVIVLLFVVPDDVLLLDEDELPDVPDLVPELVPVLFDDELLPPVPPMVRPDDEEVDGLAVTLGAVEYDPLPDEDEPYAPGAAVLPLPYAGLGVDLPEP